MKDFGYDVSDYTDVDPRFGTLADFDALLAAAHEHGLRVIIDLVINHTSDEHPWFREARQSRDASRHDWYLWHPDRRPNNWVSLFELRSAWWWNRSTSEYYYASFTRHQPEMNWRNPELRAAMYDVMRFWLDRGVDGFRLDAVNSYIKDEQLRSNPYTLRPIPGFFQRHIYDINRPETIDICREMRAMTDEYDGRMMIGEVFVDNIDLAAAFYGPNSDALHLASNFNFLYQPWSAARFAAAAQAWYRALPDGAWPNFVLSNHDLPRHYSRYSRGSETDARARVAAAMLLTLKGTPFLYYGEEIGMHDVPIPRKNLQDPLGKRTWPLRFGRDPERTPMQWDDSPNAGFTTGTPWLPLADDAQSVNVASQRDDPASLLSFYRQLLRLRHEKEALHSGEIEFLLEGQGGCLAYKRLTVGGPSSAGSSSLGRAASALGSRAVEGSNSGTSGREALGAVVVALNFRNRSLQGRAAWPQGRVLLGTERPPGELVAPSSSGGLELAPYEVVIYETEPSGQ
jgi:alpha-glucosidase